MRKSDYGSFGMGYVWTSTRPFPIGEVQGDEEINL